MRLGLLGPLLVVDEAGREVTVAASRQRVLLTALALRANQVVPGEVLAEQVWDGAPPNGAAITLRTHVRRLRMTLGPGLADRIVARPPGYLCRADEDEVDVLTFEALCRQADKALRRQRWAEASSAADRALALWRGAPLLDVPSQTLRDEFILRFEQLRVQVLENQAEADLRLGRHEPLVQQLRELVAEHPLRESFRAKLMLALARSGRRAEALAAYREARKTLAAELGIEPGPELRTLHEQILAGDHMQPDTAPSDDRVLTTTPASPVPRQLPAAAQHFTGRGTELAWLTGLAHRADPQAAASGTVVISAIDGMAGIGKTALAVHAAHLLSERFPDGQLFIDLHGYTQGQRPRTPNEALNLLLPALGVPPDRIPTDIEQAAALYRQHLADTRTLIVLDNAVTEAQVRPLLAGGGSCLVLITSRRRLKGLDDAYTLSLDQLPAAEAAALLRAVAGPDRVAAGDPLLDEVARLCAYLPLALRIAAALLRHRPTWTLAHLAGLLNDQQRRIQALSDGERDLSAVFDLSYRNLDEPHRALFRRLGLVPGPDLDRYAAAALLEVDQTTAGGRLEDLVDHNLLLCHAPGRYRPHDLIRAHARALAAADPAPDSDAAVDRLLHYYAHTAHNASVPLTRWPRPAPDGPAPADAPVLTDPETARAWLRTERDNLEHADAYAHAHKLHEHTLALAAGLAELLRTDGPYTRALALHQAAVHTAERHGHPAAHANALADLGILRRLIGDLPGAEVALDQALEIYRATGDRHGEANALSELGRLWGMAGKLAGAADALAQALAIFDATGDRHGEADMLSDLGILRRLLGDPAGAEGALDQALEIYRATGDRHGEADALSELGRVRSQIGDLAGAAGALGRALEFYRATGHHHGEAYVLTSLGTVRRLTGDLVAAGEALTTALGIYRTVGYRSGEAEALTSLGIVRRLTGDLAGAGEALTEALEYYRTTGHRHDEAWVLNHVAATVAAEGDLPRAVACYQQALAMNRELNKPDGQAVGLEGLGECHVMTGDIDGAVTHLRQAQEIYQRLGMAPDVRRVRDRLTGLAAP
jgi:DNA-binding SARP family transcriptional activator